MNSIRLIPIMVLVAALIGAPTSPAADGEVTFPKRWRGANERPVRFPNADPFPTEVRLSPDGRRLVVGWACGVRVWHLETGRAVTLQVDADEGIRRAFLSPDGRWVIGDRGSSGENGQLVIWDAATGKEARVEPKMKQERGDDWAPRLLALDKDGGAWVVRPAGVVNRVEVPSGKVTHTIKLTLTAGDYRRLVVSPGGRWLALGGSTVFAIRSTERDADWIVVERHAKPGGRSVDFPARTQCPIPAGFSTDERRLITYDMKGGGIALWSVGEKPARLASQVAKLTPWTNLNDLAYTPDGKRFGFVMRGREREDNDMRVWDAATLAEVARVAPPGGLDGFAFTPDGKRVMLTHKDGTLTVREWGSGK
jgi:WD40 repeat protein